MGATWFHLVTGRVLYEGETSAIVMVKHLNEPAPKAHRVNPQVSEAAGRLIDRLVRKNREQRIQTPKQLAALSALYFVRANMYERGINRSLPFRPLRRSNASAEGSTSGPA